MDLCGQIDPLVDMVGADYGKRHRRICFME